MQDFKHFDYIIGFDGIIKAVNDGQSVDVVINGEYYDLNTEKEIEKMTLKDLLSVYLGTYTVKVDTGCDYEIITPETDIFKSEWGDSIVTCFTANERGGLDIECDMVGTDDDGIKRNLVTWEKI